LKTLHKVTFLTSNEWRNENFEACGHKTYLIKRGMFGCSETSSATRNQVHVTKRFSIL